MSENQTVEEKCMKSCGIDFGTSVIAVSVAFSENPLGAQLVNNLQANETTPGVVKLYRDIVTIGEDALATASISPQNVFSHIPLIAVLFDSLAPEVYMISLCFTLSKLLIILVHLSSNSLLFTPKECKELEFPGYSRDTLLYISNTSFLIGVVAE